MRPASSFFFGLGFRSYLFIALSVLSVVPAAVLGTYHVVRLRQSSDELVERELRAAASQLTGDLEQVLGSIVRGAETTSKMVEARRSMAPRDLQPLVDGQLERWSELITVIVCDVHGIVIAGSPKIKADGTPVAGNDYSDRPYYHELLRTERTTISDVLLSRATGLPAIVVAVPIHDPENILLGYTAASFEFKRFGLTAERIRRGLRDAQVLLYDDRGHVLLDTAGTHRKDASRLLGLPLFASAGLDVDWRSGQDLQGQRVRAAATSLRREALHWNVVIYRSEASIGAEASRSAQSTILITLLAVLLAFGVSALLAEFLSRPLQSVVDGAVALGQGDFARALPAKTRFMPREARQLVEAFESMVAQLRELLVSLRVTQTQMSNAFTELAAVNAQQSDFVQRQNHALEELDASAQEIRHRGEAAAARAQAVLARGVRADSVSQEGQQALETSFRALDELREQSAQVHASLAGLLERTDRLEEIISTVGDLAERSNVVALNAAIEAAKAKDRGKVFAIVAEEIRSLANQSAKSTQDIGAIVTELSGAIRSRVEFSHASSARTREGLTELHSSSERMRELAQFLSQSTSAAQEIAGDVQQQRTVIGEVSAALERLRVSMQETEAASRRANETAQGLRESSEALTRLVGRFQL